MKLVHLAIPPVHKNNLALALTIGPNPDQVDLPDGVREAVTAPDRNHRTPALWYLVSIGVLNGRPVAGYVQRRGFRGPRYAHGAGHELRGDGGRLGGIDLRPKLRVPEESCTREDDHHRSCDSDACSHQAEPRMVFLRDSLERQRKLFGRLQRRGLDASFA